jgi:tRNA-dihydrouridine synthase
MLNAYGFDLGVRVARKHLRWYLDAANMPLKPEQRRALLTETNPEKVEEQLVCHMQNQKISSSVSAA